MLPHTTQADTVKKTPLAHDKKANTALKACPTHFCTPDTYRSPLYVLSGGCLVWFDYLWLKEEQSTQSQFSFCSLGKTQTHTKTHHDQRPQTALKKHLSLEENKGKNNYHHTFHPECHGKESKQVKTHLRLFQFTYPA